LGQVIASLGYGRDSFLPTGYPPGYGCDPLRTGERAFTGDNPESPEKLLTFFPDCVKNKIQEAVNEADKEPA